MLPTRKSLANPHACLESEFDDHPGSKIPKGMNILVEGGGAEGWWLVLPNIFI